MAFVDEFQHGHFVTRVFQICRPDRVRRQCRKAFFEDAMFEQRRERQRIFMAGTCAAGVLPVVSKTYVSNEHLEFTVAELEAYFNQ